MKSRRLAALVALCSLPAFGADAPSPAASDAVVSAQQIEQALQHVTTRALRVEGTAEPAQAIALNVPFEFNSSELQPAATAQLAQLKSALNSPTLAADRFQIAGHTDAKGSARYNLQLSSRRAEAVRRFLIDGGVAAVRLDAVGHGSEQLLAPDRPLDPINRRVEIRNLGPKP